MKVADKRAPCRRVAIALSLSLAVLSPQVSAVSRSADATGGVLIFPYYNSHDGNASLLSVSNTRDDRSVAMAVSILGQEPPEQADLVVYLPPSASWNGAIVSEGEQSKLFGTDINCQHPAASEVSAVALPRSGFLVVYELGVLDPGHPLASAVLPTRFEIGDASEQDAAQRRNCAAITQAWAPGGIWANTPDAGLQPPQDSLTGHLQIVDSLRGIGFSLAPTVLDGFSAVSLHRDITRFKVSLNDAQPPVSSHALAGVERQSSFARGVDAVSAALMTRAARADFWQLPHIPAHTDLVLSFPTWSWYSTTDPGPFQPNAVAGSGTRLNFDVRDRNGLPFRSNTSGPVCDPPPPPRDARPQIAAVVMSFSTSREDPLDPAAQPLAWQSVAPDCGGIGQSAIAGEQTGSLSVFARKFSGFTYGEPQQSFRSLEGHVFEGLPGILTVLARVRPDYVATTPGQVVNSYGFSLPVEIKAGARP